MCPTFIDNKRKKKTLQMKGIGILQSLTKRLFDYFPSMVLIPAVLLVVMLVAVGFKVVRFCVVGFGLNFPP